MNWASIQTKAMAILTIIGVALAGVLRFRQVKGQRDDARDQRDQESARADQAEKINQIEAEIENEFSDLEREAERAIENGKMPDNIRNRNDW